MRMDDVAGWEENKTTPCGRCVRCESKKKSKEKFRLRCVEKLKGVNDKDYELKKVKREVLLHGTRATLSMRADGTTRKGCTLRGPSEGCG